MKPKTKQRKEREIDKDTVVAYHDFIQGRIQGALNGVAIGPGHFLSKIALASFIFGLVCLVVGILLITLRHRHVYLVDWNDQFVGPFFVILFLLLASFATFLLLMAKRRTNTYRGDLRFRPIGDYGVAVVHTSKLTYDDQKRTELKSGTTPHNVRHPGRPGVNEKSNQGDYSKSRGYDNRGYKREDRHDDRRDRPEYDREKREKDKEYRDMVRDYRDGGGRRPEGERRPDEERRRRPPPDDDRRRRPPGPDDDRRRRPPPGPDDERRRRPPPDGERRRPPGDDRGRRPPPDDREKGRRGGPQPPRDPEEAKRREERRRQYEEEKRRRYEEDRRRAELRKQAEAESSGQPEGSEREVDVDGNRTYQIQTTVKLSRQMQETDESEL